MRFECQTCGVVYPVNNGLLGKTVLCKKCNAKQIVRLQPRQKAPGNKHFYLLAGILLGCLAIAGLTVAGVMTHKYFVEAQEKKKEDEEEKAKRAKEDKDKKLQKIRDDMNEAAKQNEKAAELLRTQQLKKLEGIQKGMQGQEEEQKAKDQATQMEIEKRTKAIQKERDEKIARERIEQEKREERERKITEDKKVISNFLIVNGVAGMITTWHDPLPAELKERKRIKDRRKKGQFIVFEPGTEGQLYRLEMTNQGLRYNSYFFLVDGVVIETETSERGWEYVKKFNLLDKTRE